ncbi:universal stress protein [Nocardia sp. NPDC051052]|uniref:universal stress protein n=1 Tax=Nocardia sp. NPDC051052 TaxID=3364322 RepID=UPI0037996962
MTEQIQPRRGQREHTRTPVIVVGFDASLPAEHALAYAAGVACRLHATLDVTHVNRVATGASLAGLAPGIVTVTELADDDARVAHAAAAAAAILDGLAVSWTFISRTGDPAVELARLAQEHGADIVVVGQSSQWWHRLAGSVPVRLTRRSGCPVTVVP